MTLKTFAAACILASTLAPACAAAEPIAAPLPRPKEAAAPVPTPDASKIPPDFSLPAVGTGKTVTLSKYRGKVVLLDFWATWCGPCRMEIPHLIELQKAYRDQGFNIIGVSLDRQGEPVVKSFMEQWKVNYTMVMDSSGQLANTYGGIRSIPTTLLIGRDGEVKQVFVGYNSKEIFEEAIKKALGPLKSQKKPKPKI
jgi:thiol-disulfide isomerase/thioredoxin